MRRGGGGGVIFGKTLNFLGDEYARLLKTENRDEGQQKLLEKLHWQLMVSGCIGGWNTHMENWLPKLKDKLRNDLSQLDSLAAEMGRASKERTNAEMSLAYLEDFLKSDYNRIREHEQLRIQIENYHNELEPQEDGTYKCVWQSRSLSPMTSQRVKAKIKK